MILLLTLAMGQCAAAQDLAAAGETLRREVLTPLYATYAQAARALADLEPDCAADWRGAYVPAFARSVLAWRRLEAAGYGPAAVPETAAAVFFWPDQHGTAGRQLGVALKKRDPAFETAAGLAGRSVALQSLTALEVLLQDPSAGEDDAARRFACRYAGAIADFQADLARRLAAVFERDPAQPAAVAQGLLAGMRTTLDTLIAFDLERPLGTDLATARGEQARAWRSGLSLPLILAALDTVEEVYTTPGGFPPLILASAEIAAFDAVLRGRLAAARTALGRITVPLRLAVADPAQRPLVEAALEELRGVRRLIMERLAPALGLALGFNALDGD